MERIDISNIEIAHIEPRGHSPKYWINNGKKKLVKFNNPLCKNADVMESFSSSILRLLGINTVNVELAINNNIDLLNQMKVKDRNCCIVDSFLNLEGDNLIEITERWPKVRTNNVQKDISSCFYKVFNAFSKLFGINDEDLEKMKIAYIRQVFGDCILQNEDRPLRNVGIIYNELIDTYDLAPSYDNALSFMSYDYKGVPKCYIGNQSFEYTDIIDYILKNYYDYIDDILVNLEDLADFSIDIVTKFYQGEIEEEKLEYIKEQIKNINNYINAKLTQKNNIQR